jgi:hypothetical protein
MLEMNLKKFREIKNKSIPSPLRPRFRQKAQTNIYFLSQRKVSGEKKVKLLKNLKLLSALSIILVGGYFLTS